MAEGVRIFSVGKSDRPSELERAAISRIKTTPGELRTAYLLENKRIRGGDDSLVEGAVYEFDPKAAIREGSPIVVFGDKLFGHILTAKILDERVDEGLMRQKLQLLADAIPVSSSKPYSLAQHCSPGIPPMDVQSWEHELGRHGHVVGLHKEERERTLPVYSLVVHSDAGSVGRELVDKFVVPRLGSLTYRDLLKSTEYARASLYSLRNAQRILAHAAEVLGLRIYRADDPWAHTDASLFEAPPDLGVPTTVTEYNTLKSILRPFGESIAFYSRAAHLGSAQGGCVAHLVDPVYGLAMYSGDPRRSKLEHGAFSNNACSAFPVCTGRVPDPALVSSRQQALLRDRSAQAYLSTVISWQNKKIDTPIASHPALYSYADFSLESIQLHQRQLGAQFGHTRLKPVMQIIAPPSPIPSQ